jgi:two-component system heavy metal sensor histidine kinase CusS
MTPRDGVTLYSVWSADSSYHYGKPVTGQVMDRWSGGYERVRTGPGSENDMLTNTVELPAYGVRGRPCMLQVAAGYSANARTMRAFGFALAALCPPWAVSGCCC